MNTHSLHKITRGAAALLALCLLPGYGFAVNEALVHRKADGSRADAAHRIILRDADFNIIAKDDLHPAPFSTKFSCGECHDYAKISRGWHFSNMTSETAAGRPGEPWILSDSLTKTQLPVSLHKEWKGTWQPEKLGMSPWRFVMAFGSHLPGGGVGEVDADSTATLDVSARWDQSGQLEVNCLGCHSGSAFQDQSEFAAQVADFNLKWAATAASGLGSVTGKVKSLPAYLDLGMGRYLDDPDQKPPRVAYNASNFDPENRVYMSIKGRPDDGRCYFCHSTAHMKGDKWQTDQDVHLAAGLHCVDCHRNGIDHQITRGNEDDPAVKADTNAMTLTCKGCHMGDGEAVGGRLRAPRPLHKGLPLVHLEKMSCTSCHSGPALGQGPELVKTSRTHKLGTRVMEEPTLPLIAAPVFVKNNGKMQPANVVWPAFWGVMQGEDVTPLLPEKVREVAQAQLLSRIDDTTGTETVLNDGKVAAVLKALAAAKVGEGEPVYVSGGKLHKLATEGKLATTDHPSAQAYSWPIGHDVRPATQALGVKGCTECHAEGAPFFFGQVQVADTLRQDKPAMVAMSQFEGQDIKFAQMFGMSFKFRPWFKIFGFGASGLVLGVMLSYGLMGLGALCRLFGRRKK